MGKDLRQFLQVVKEAGSDFYVEVKRPLKPKLEVCVIQQKLAKEGRFPVIYCPEIEGSKLPLVTNLLGSYELLGLALDIDPKKADKAEILQEFKRRQANIGPPETVLGSEAPVKEVVLRGKDVDLGLLPITQHGELDSGKYITIGSMICRDPDTGIPNVGVYRMEVKGKDQLSCGMGWVHHAGHIARRHSELGRPMEVVISLGHHPAAILGLLSKGGMDLNELEAMGGLLGEPLQVTPAETVDLSVPALAEIVIEGVMDTSNMVTDGPFAEYTGYYGLKGSQPAYLIQVTAITMRKDAIYHDLDPAHQEHNLALVLAYESSIYDAVKRVVPAVKAVHSPPSGTCIFHTYISIKKRVPGEGKLAGLAALGGTPDVKVAFVVDEDIDVFDDKEVLWAMATRLEGDKGITIIPEVAGANLDPSGYDETHLKWGPMNTKVIIDATKPVDLPFATRITPPEQLWDAMKLEDYLR